MSTWAAMYVVYNEEEYIEYSITSVIDRMDHVIVLRGLKPWHGPELAMDGTSDRIRAMSSTKITLVEGCWESEAEQRNEALELAQELGCDYGLIIDADEVYGCDELDEIIRVVELNPQFDVWRAHWWTYWKSPLWRIEPPEPFAPSIAVRLDGGLQFQSLRELTAGAATGLISQEPFLHHFSYAKPSGRILDKIGSFEHAHEILDGWWEHKWLAWDNDHGLRDLHPTVPWCYRRARYVDPEHLPALMRVHPYVTEGVNGLMIAEDDSSSLE